MLMFVISWSANIFVTSKYQNISTICTNKDKKNMGWVWQVENELLLMNVCTILVCLLSEMIR